MQLIHFTEGATDPLEESESRAAHFVRLIEGSGSSQLGCLHLQSGGKLGRRSIDRKSALLSVQGSMSVIQDSGLRLEMLAGMGVVLEANEVFALESDTGGIALLVQAERLLALADGISTPARIQGQRWPGEPERLDPQNGALPD